MFSCEWIPQQLSYINRMKSIRFSHLSAPESLVLMCGFFIYASYVPIAQNVKVDAESRIISEEMDRTFKQYYFIRINTFFDFFNMNLFVSSINIKYQYFVF